MTRARVDVGASPISRVRGYWQGLGLRAASAVAFVAAVAALVLPESIRGVPAVAAVGIVIAAPLVRVAWLIVRWAQDRDWRFVLAGLSLLAVVALGSVAALV